MKWGESHYIANSAVKHIILCTYRELYIYTTSKSVYVHAKEPAKVRRKAKGNVL